MKLTKPVYRYASARTSVRLVLAASIASCFVVPFAQAEDATELEEVVVTGSRIAAPNQTSTSPILTITAEDIKTGGHMDLTDVLNMLPQVNSNSLGQDLGNKTSGLTSAGGVATADLRGLGPNRTLVLVNGRRLGTGSPQTVIASPAPDIDQIPTALIESIDVVTGGASAVYGSDAISGVVNFITKRNFEGLELDGQMGGFWHDNNNGHAKRLLEDGGFTGPSGTSWDGRTVNFSVTAGTNFMDGRGNVTAYFGYQNMHPVTSDKRDFGACQMFFDDTYDDLVCSGSSNSNYFYPTNATANTTDDVWSVKGNQFVLWGTQDTNPPAIANSQAFIYAQRQDTRYNGGFLAHVDVNDYVKPYLEFMFMDDRTHQEVAPTALFRQSNPLTDDGNYLINCSNPLLSAQQQSLMCTPAEVAADTLNPGSASADVEIGRRNFEGGSRTYDFKHSNYRMVLGTKGDVAEGWNYDAYGQYYYTNFASINGSDFGFDKISNALQVTGTAANPVCISGGACVPYNIFQDGGVTPEAVTYLTTLGTATGSTELKTIHGDITGDLGTYGLKLPTASQGIGVNFGYEYRNEHIVYLPDAAYESGLIVGTGGAYPRIDNSISVKEVFGEARIPIAADMPGIYDLVADTGYRHSKYSQAGGVNTYKFELQYAPIADYRFRASYNHAIRAPAVVELFNPQLVGKISFGEDPCAPGETSGVASATLAQCQNTGVTPAQYGNGGTTNTIPQGTAGQLTQLQGGNPNLSPEKANTYTLGLNFRPSALPDLSGSLDYYHIKMKNLVGALPAQLIMSSCLATGDPTYCSQLSRHPLTGSLNGASVTGGGYIIQTNVNIGAGTLNGIDLQTNYKVNLGSLGALRLTLNGAYMLKNTTTPLPGGGSYDCAGLFGPTCQTVNPKWSHSLRGSMDVTPAIKASLTWRFHSGVKLDNNDSNPLLFESALGDVTNYRATMPAISYFDLAGTWNATKMLQLRLGINNLLDKDPPLAPTEIISGGAANYYEFYDGLGRQVFAAFTMKL